MSTDSEFRTSTEARRRALSNFDSFELPASRFSGSAVPELSVAADLAALVKKHVAPPGSVEQLAVTEAIVEASGWHVSYRAIMSSDGSKSTLRSLLIPLLIGGFSVVINTEHGAGNDGVAVDMGHEIGHSFFYDQRVAPPKKIGGVRLGEGHREEDFCNRFAHELTGLTIDG